MADLKRLKGKQRLAWQLYQKIKNKYGNNPYLVAAQQGISVKLYSEPPQRLFPARAISVYHPENLTIDIYKSTLVKFWNELFPGCSPSLSYQYACWRGLWSYWGHSRFAPLRYDLGSLWMKCVEKFAKCSPAENEYLGHYFAALATGLLDWEEPAEEEGMQA